MKRTSKVKKAGNKTRKSQPAPAPTHEIARRLEYIRELRGVNTLAEFHRKLMEPLTPSEAEAGTGFDVKYGSVVRYHYDREPPPTYLARVALVYRVSLLWLITGDGYATEDEHALAQAWQTKSLRRRVKAAFYSELSTFPPQVLEPIEPMLWRLWETTRMANPAAFTDYEAGQTHMVEYARHLARALRAPLLELRLDLINIPSLYLAQNYLATVALALTSVIYPMASPNKKEPANDEEA